MDFTIISLGNVEFLTAILNGVAMICGTGDYTRLVAVGFVIGLLFVGFQCIFEGAQKINLHHSFLCFLCYLCMFGPSCTCIIEDAYTGKARTVDNVPLGVGVAGTAISGIGYGVTRLLEQGFSTFDRTSEHQFAEPLRILNKIRTVAESDMIFNVINRELGPRANGAPSDSKQALINYLSECTMAKIQLGGTTATELYSATWDSEAFKFTSEAHTVMLPIGGMGNSEVVTCNAGYAKLNTILQKFSSSQVKQAVNQYLHLKDENGNTIATNMDKVDSAMKSLNATMNGSQDYMQMIVIESVYNQAAAKFYNTQQDTASAIAVNQGIIQRNTQWASEGTMFLSASRALMAFFEGFIYAITPIMGFLIAIGSFGIGLVGKYFLTIAWIQLWLPILSILNLYVLTGARSAITDANLGTGASFYAIDTLWSETATWVATGGMLTAATPMLALFLVSGSTFAFTSLAGRLKGQDHFNERIATPDAASPSAVMSHAAHWTADHPSGVRQMGFDSIAPKINISNAMDRAVASKQGIVNADQKTFTAAITDQYQTGKTNQSVQQFMQSMGESLSSTKVDGVGTVESVIANSKYTEGMKAEEIHQATGVASAMLSGEISLGKGGKVGAFKVKDKNGEEVTKVFGDGPGKVLAALGIGLSADASGKAQMSFTGSTSDSYSDSNSSGREFGRQLSADQSKSLAANLTEGYQAQLNNTTSQMWGDLANSNKGTTVGDAAAKLRASTEAYEKVDAFRSQISGTQSSFTFALAHKLQNKQMGKELANFERSAEGQKAGLAKQANKYASMLSDNRLDKNGQRMVSEQAKIASALDFLANSNKPEHNEMLVKALMAADTPTINAPLVNPDKYKDSLEQPGNVSNDIQNARQSIESGKASIHDGKPKAVDFESSKQEVRDKNQGQVADVDQNWKTIAEKPLSEAKQLALKGLEQRSRASGMTRFANKWLRDGVVDSFSKQVIDPYLDKEKRVGKAPNEADSKHRGNLHNGGEQSLAAKVDNVVEALTPEHHQTIRHLSEAQGNFVVAYHNYQMDQTPENAKALDQAFIGVRNEMMQTMGVREKPENMSMEEYRKETAGAYRDVARATVGMTDQLMQVHDFDNQAAANNVTRFNFAYGIKSKI